MASWAAILALSGFRYSGVTKSMAFDPNAGTHFWSNGDAWGNCILKPGSSRADVRLTVLGGEVHLNRFELSGFGEREFAEGNILRGNAELQFSITRA